MTNIYLYNTCDNSLSTLETSKDVYTFVLHNIWVVDQEPRSLHCFNVPMEGNLIEYENLMRH